MQIANERTEIDHRPWDNMPNVSTVHVAELIGVITVFISGARCAMSARYNLRWIVMAVSREITGHSGRTAFAIAIDHRAGFGNNRQVLPVTRSRCAALNSPAI
jgi:hypothetical protein